MRGAYGVRDTIAVIFSKHNLWYRGNRYIGSQSSNEIFNSWGRHNLNQILSNNVTLTYMKQIDKTAWKKVTNLPL